MQEKLLQEPGSAGDDTRQDAGSSSDTGLSEYPSKDVNRRIAVVSAIAAVGLFLSTRLDVGISLKDLSASALPYEEVCLYSLFFPHVDCIVNFISGKFVNKHETDLDEDFKNSI